MTDTPARLLRLLSLMQTPREWSGRELAERLGVSRRTIRRDIDRLRGLGYPVEATMGADGGYRLGAGQALPPLVLDDEEAVAIAVGLRVAAGHAVEGIEEASLRALTKLLQVLPSRLRHRVATVNAATVSLMPGDGATMDPEQLAVMATAIANHERLRFAYESQDGAPSRRLVEPARLVAARHRWYLVAFDNDRNDWRIFRADRISGAQATGLRGPARELPAPNAAEYVAGKLYDRSRTYRAVVVLHASVQDVRARMRGARADVEPIGQDRCRLRTRADSLEWIAFRLIQLDCDFEVEEPAQLAAYVSRLGVRLTAAGRRSGAGEDTTTFDSKD